MQLSHSLLCRTVCGAIVPLMMLAACGQGDRAALPPVPVAAAPAANEAYPGPNPTRTPAPYDPNDLNTLPTAVVPPLTQTADALADAARQSLDNRRATEKAESANYYATQRALPETPTFSPEDYEMMTEIVVPDPTRSPGLFQGYPHCIEQYRSDLGEFGVLSCWKGVYNGLTTRIVGGGLITSDTGHYQNMTFDGGLYIYTVLDEANDVERGEFFETPNKELTEITSVDGDIVTVRTIGSGTMYTFNLASRTWSEPLVSPTPTPEAQPEAQPTSTIEALPEALPTPTPITTIFMPWVQ